MMEISFLRNIKQKLKQMCNSFKIIITLPHFVAVIILLLLAFISIGLAYIHYASNSFLSSILSNIFAGLVTGIAVCFISGTRQMNKNMIEGKIVWLRAIHNDFLKFNNHYKELLCQINDPTFSRKELYDEIYDVLCEGNNINLIISQSQHNKTLPFNPYIFFAKELKYDSLAYKKKNDITREKIISINMDTVTKTELQGIFKEMVESLFLLNGTILAKIKELEIKQNMSNKLFF